MPVCKQFTEQFWCFHFLLCLLIILNASKTAEYCLELQGGSYLVTWMCISRSFNPTSQCLLLLFLFPFNAIYHLGSLMKPTVASQNNYFKSIKWNIEYREKTALSSDPLEVRNPRLQALILESKDPKTLKSEGGAFSLVTETCHWRTQGEQAAVGRWVVLVGNQTGYGKFLRRLCENSGHTVACQWLA